MLKSFWDVLRLYNDPPLYNCAGLKQIVEREEQEQIESSHTLPNEFHDNIQPNPNTSPNNTMSYHPLYNYHLMNLYTLQLTHQFHQQ